MALSGHRRVAVLLVAAIAFWNCKPALLVPRSLQTEFRPVALAISAQGDVYVLDGSNRVLRYSSKDLSSLPKTIVTLRSSWEVDDMALAHDNDGDHLFITLTQGNSGQLMQYSGDGKFEGSWFQFSQLSGVCADEVNRRVYITAWGTGQIFRHSVGAPEKAIPQPFFRFVNARNLGSLAIDPAGGKLYAAELMSGQVFELDLKSMASREVAENIGQPTAIAYAPQSKRLYIADGAGRRIWSVSLSPKLRSPAIFVKSEAFRAPSAIAVASDGSVWVGDQQAHVVFQFSSDHQLLRTLR